MPPSSSEAFVVDCAECISVALAGDGSGCGSGNGKQEISALWPGSELKVVSRVSANKIRSFLVHTGRLSIGHAYTVTNTILAAAREKEGERREGK